MSKFCICCGNKNNDSKSGSLLLDNDEFLCNKCIEPIRYELENIVNAKTKKEFTALAHSIIRKSEKLFDDDVINQICTIINKRCKTNGFSLKISEEYEDEYEDAPLYNHQNEGGAFDNSGGMFKNIGGKIKGLAKILTWIGIIASFFCGATFMADMDEELFSIGLIVIIVGSLVSWVSSFLLYGFGQLVQNSDKLVKLQEKNNKE